MNPISLGLGLGVVAVVAWTFGFFHGRLDEQQRQRERL